MYRFAWFVASVVATVALVVSVAPSDSERAAAEETAHPPHQQPSRPRSAITATPSDVTGEQIVSELVQHEVRLSEYLTSLEQERIANEEREQQLRDAAARALPSSPSTSRGSGHSDAWWRAIAICEQGGRNDPFFGFFSIMDGSAGGLTWDAQVRMANAIVARAGDRAWASSCLAHAYAAVPSG